MTSTKNLDVAQRLLLRRGTPAAPAITEVSTEVRTNAVIAVPTPAPDEMKHVIGTTVIEWSFRVAHARIREFNTFLADNEAFIAESCEKLMQGVHYRGTYMTTHGERTEYHTYWAYDSQAAEKQWEHGLAKAGANFTKALRRLRSYWLHDPNASHRHLAPAALFAKNPGSPFFDFTLETAEQMAGTTAPKRSARRKAARKI
jgi:hypothetical protein